MSCTLKPAIWSRDTGQRIPYFDRCQLIITWMFNIKEVNGKPRLHVSVNLVFGVWPPCCATPSTTRQRRRRAYAPTSNAAGHEKNQLTGSLFFPIWVWGSDWRHFRPSELRYNGVVVMRGQRHITSKNWPKYPIPPLRANWA